MLDALAETSTFKVFEAMAAGDFRSRQGLITQRAKERSMLVLSRKKDESIVINNDITIVVVEIRGDKVRLGVEAPKEVPVHRREVYDAIARGEPIEVSFVAPVVKKPGSEAAHEQPEQREQSVPDESTATSTDAGPPATDAIS